MKIDKATVLNRIRAVRDNVSKYDLISEDPNFVGHFHSGHKPIPTDLPNFVEALSQNQTEVNPFKTKESEPDLVTKVSQHENICTNDAEAILLKLRNTTKAKRLNYSID